MANAESRALNKMLGQKIVVIASGGGGIPVMQGKNGDLKGLEAVIDKDRAGEVMAEAIGADTFHDPNRCGDCKINFGKENEKTSWEDNHRRGKKICRGGTLLGWKHGTEGRSLYTVSRKGGKKQLLLPLTRR